MAENASPLAFQDVFGRVHIEPSVSGVILTQQKESPRAVNPNDIIMLAAFRSGAPLVLRRFSSESAVRNAHDPDGNGGFGLGDGVDLLAYTRDPFGDDGMFGSADFLTVRVGAPTQASTVIKKSSTELVTITTADYGRHTNRCFRNIVAETVSGTGMKLVLRDENNTKRKFVGRNLGPLLNVQYIGQEAGCDVSVRGAGGTITYTGQPVDGNTVVVNGVTFEIDTGTALITYTGQPTDEDTITVVGGGSTKVYEFDEAKGTITYTDQPVDGETITINGKIYEFDNDDAVVGTNIKVTIGATAADTYAALGVAITGNQATIAQTAGAGSLVLHEYTDGITIAGTVTNATITSNTGVTGVNIPVIMGATDADTYDALAAAITANQATISQTPGAGSLLLSNFTTGVTLTDNAGNATITNNGGVSGGNTPVYLRASAADTYAALGPAIQSATGVSVVQTSGVLTLNGDLGVVLSGTLTNATIAETGDTASVIVLAITGGPTHTLPLNLSSYNTITAVVAAINALDDQQSFKASLPTYASTNPFLRSSALDLLAATACKTAAQTLYGYAAAIADWVNRHTQGNYTATVEAQNEQPDDDSADVQFSGGTTPASVTIDDYAAGLDVVGSEVELGGIILLDTTEPAIMRAVVDFIAEQQTRGKWFRAFFGASFEEGDATARATEFGQIASGLDSSRARLVCQRMGVFLPNSGGAIGYVSPLYLAATMAGGAAGNLPYVNPLTMKRLRYPDVHPDDRFDEVTREALIQAGVTVVKREGTSRVVSLAVTTSQDPSRRMNRVMSERDTVDEIDANVRQAFLPFRGKWANLSLAATVPGVMRAVLDRYVRAGAISKGIDPDTGKAVPAWEGVPIGPNGESWILNQGVLTVRYRIFVPGELNHISLTGFAEYVALSGSIGGSVAELSTTIPV